MTWWLVAWIGFSCPGGLFGKFLPTAVKPFACTQEIKHKICSSKREAHRAVRKAGCGTKLFWCEGLKCYEKRVECPTTIVIDGEEADK